MLPDGFAIRPVRAFDPTVFMLTTGIPGSRQYWLLKKPIFVSTTRVFRDSVLRYYDARI